MTAVALLLLCVAPVAVACLCLWRASRTDRARDARDVVVGAEHLCRTAAADPYHLNTEETDQP